MTRTSYLTTLLGSTALVLAAMPAAAQDNGATLPDIQVQGAGGGYAPSQPGLAKLTEPVLDTPTSITTISGQLMQDRGEATLNDALRNAPGVTLTAGEFQWEGNAPYIRGFNARTDMFVDGMRDIGNYNRDPWNLEKVEILSGPDSILFGRGSTGGVINQVSKSPAMQAFSRFSAAFSTDDTKRVTADLNMPLADLAPDAAVRLNVMGDTGGVAGRDIVHNQRYGFAPSLSLGLGTATRWNLSYFHQSEDNQPDYGLPWLLGKPAPVARDNYYGYRNTDYLKTDADIVTGKVEHDLTDDVTLRGQVRYANYFRNVSISKAAIPAGVTAATPVNTINANINHYLLDSTEEQFQSQADVIARFDTGFIHHALVAGLEYDSEGSDPNYYNSNGLTPKNLASPDESLIYNPAQTYPRHKAVTHTSTVGAYVMDTMKLSDQFQVIAGLRWDSFAATFHDRTYSVPPAATGVVTATNDQHRVDSMPSYRGALVYKPVEEGTFYFSYGTSFNPTVEALNFINSGENYNVANQSLKPEKNNNYEAGVKWGLMNDRLFLSGAVFRSEKTNARIPDPANPGFNMLGGNQRVDGFELQAQGAVTADWNVQFGYDYLSSNTIKTSPGGPPLHFQLPFTPRSSASFWTTYNVTDRIQLGGGGQYVGARYAQTTNPRERVPDYLVVDLMGRYRFSEKFDVQLNVYNVGDKYYYDTLHPAFVIPGAGRSAMLTLNYDY
jgi:catecholate siderophore receptor